MQKSDISDASLVMLTLAGDQSAYEKLVIRHQSAVIASAMSVTKRRFIAEDAAQDAFVTAWIKLNTLNEPEKFAQWVRRIARNCALSDLRRYRSFISADEIDLLNIPARAEDGPAEIYYRADSRAQLRRTVGKLPERIKLIIELYYFEGLDVAEIAERLGSAEGTVKHQLHEGRKKLRKELCAMDETLNDTLVQRVMKKVEELKNWKVKNDKSGFETVYNDVLKDVEDLPECMDKYHALADVLMCGWWWLTGEKNDALFERIKESALKGKNEDVMKFILSREVSKLWGSARIDFIKNKQLPMLEKAGFKQALAYEWFCLGNAYFDEKKVNEATEAIEKARALLSPADPYYIMSVNALAIQNMLASDYKDKKQEHYLMLTSADVLKLIDGEMRFYNSIEAAYGALYTLDFGASDVFANASRCDGKFFQHSLSVGDSYTGSDGSKLTLASDSETVDTPAGRFDNCFLYVTEYISKYSGPIVYKTYYKDGIGIVKQETAIEGVRITVVVKSYAINGGHGLLPLAKGNSWEYVDTRCREALRSDVSFKVAHIDEENCIIGSIFERERFKYDENDWTDMVIQIRNEYCNHGYDQKLQDVSFAIERAEALAKTPMERAHTKAAVSVIKRILETDPIFNPNYTATGHWNFFCRYTIVNNNNCLKRYDARDFSFEWKNTGGHGDAETPILFNDLYGLIYDATNCLWSDEWILTPESEISHRLWDEYNIKTQILCENGGSITTGAGTFENCIKLSFDTSGMTYGLSYRNGAKRFYYAKGIGIVRAEIDYCNGARTAVYELTEYEGTGEGYMPIEDGMMRRYDAIGLTDGFVASAVYTYVKGEDGETVIFEDRTGIREIPVPITQYSAIQSEIKEQELMDAGNWKDAQLQNALNQLKIMLHAICRPTRNRHNAVRSVELQGFNLKLMEQFGDGEVPPAWYGVYSWIAVIRAAAFFGNKQKEEGYKHLEISAEYLSKWSAIPNGAELDTGNAYVFGGIKYIKNDCVFLLPNGTKEPIAYDYIFEEDADLLYDVMTAPRGWEWFNSVRNEERFQELVEKAREIGKNNT